MLLLLLLLKNDCNWAREWKKCVFPCKEAGGTKEEEEREEEEEEEDMREDEGEDEGGREEAREGGRERRLDFSTQVACRKTKEERCAWYLDDKRSRPASRRRGWGEGGREGGGEEEGSGGTSR